MDKYEEAAGEFYYKSRPPADVERRMAAKESKHDRLVVLIADAFRWYDEQRAKDYETRPETLFVRHIEEHLRSTSGAIPMCKICGKTILEIADGYEQRAKEVCACTADEVKGKGYSHCHYCGKLIPNSRRIVEKEGV